ncbi:phosphocholine-specific phospholipase C [Cupriavidus taiwanensis]|uniref:phosphocholine-specific phospholipase C n=1 Tax=Cupriavidus taiwanensis TaxID=164546 RepID=UPI000E10C6A6|nr:phospholipase C, phosphocholine-specific [Cupriavidus taiwanensis]SOY61243.1 PHOSPHOLIPASE C (PHOSPHATIDYLCHOLINE CHOLINEPHOSPHOHYDROLASE) SIGNAL PEPTIDE PROTEIN [Cupriavidus taiwanensis]SOY61461.1 PHOSPHOLIPASE C (PHOSPHATIDYLCHOLINE CHOLINEPHOSPHOHYDROLASE) SIGNAL PEPTIDE PROTEIN [Cupriavidus taiwanensis]SOY97956.1 PHOSPHOLIPASE C (PHOSPHATIDYLCHOLINE CHOLINEPHOSPHOHYDROLASE) SIGNAL PEPTIDE PROTEIN [Cupriavidus taiwanensis]SOZ67790.1 PHOSPHOLIPASE C (PHOSPHATIDYLCHOLINE CHOLINEPHOSPHOHYDRO
MNSQSRRNFLKLASGSAAATAALAAFPPSIRRALAIPANNATGTIRDVEHVVILMQENRSFDNYFGTLRGVRGFGDRFPIPLAGGLNVWQQTYANGSTTRTVLPYHLDSSAGNAQRVSGTPHSYPDAQNAWDLGRMNKWPTYKQTQSMGFYTEAELDFQVALANAFTLCDAYHCSFHGGTNPNRLFHWTGTNDPAGASGGPVIDNSGDSFTGSAAPYTWKTYPERLETAGVSWKVYQNLPDNFTDNPLAGFKQYRDANAARGNQANGSPYPPYTSADDAISPLLKGVANTMPDGGFLQALRDDVAAGKLPQVSWIVAPATYSEHPGPSSPVQGAWYTQEVLDALTANPAVWSKTVLLINFDENDGYFDHLPPPCAPAYDGDTLAGATTLDPEQVKPEYHVDKRPYGPGPRVPMYVVSPWSRGGWVNSQVFDHTSVLRFLEARFGVAEPNISGFRRAVAGDLTSAFNFVSPNTNPLPQLPSRDKASADAIRTAQGVLPQVPLPPAGSQQMPRQDPGTRPSRALPYELHVSAREDARDQRALWLLFSNTGTAAAVFHVYDRLHLDRVPRRYMVEPGKELHGSWDVFASDGGKYDLWVLGPNGFHRAFRGDVAAVTAAGASAPEIRVCYDIANAAVYVDMINTGSAPCTFTVQPNAYRADGPWTYEVPAGMQLQQHWPVARQGNWYDFTVTTAQGGFARRFAGRIETGTDGVSDPAMGAAG